MRMIEVYRHNVSEAESLPYLDHGLADREFAKLMEAWQSHISTGQPVVHEITASLDSWRWILRLDRIDAICMTAQDEYSAQFLIARNTQNKRHAQRIDKAVDKEMSEGAGFLRD